MAALLLQKRTFAYRLLMPATLPYSAPNCSNAALSGNASSSSSSSFIQTPKNFYLHNHHHPHQGRQYSGCTSIMRTPSLLLSQRHTSQSQPFNSTKQVRSFSSSTLQSEHMQPITATSQSAVRLYDEGVNAYLQLAGDPIGLLERSFKQDPTLIMAPLLQAAILLLSTSVSAAHPHVKRAREVAASAMKHDNNTNTNTETKNNNKMTSRERSLALAVESFAHGRWRFALQVLEAALSVNPNDAVLLRINHDAYYFLGDARNLRDGVSRVWSAWYPGMPDYSRVAGMFAFGLEECGSYERGEEMAMAALAQDPFDAWATHAVAHVYEMTSRREDGERLLKETEDTWKEAQLFAHHIYWHWALFGLQTGIPGYRQAFARYDKAICQGVGKDGDLLFVDAASLLWRLELLAHPLGLGPPLKSITPPSKQVQSSNRLVEDDNTNNGSKTNGSTTMGRSRMTVKTRWDYLADSWLETSRAGGPNKAAQASQTHISHGHLNIFNDIHAVMIFGAVENWCKNSNYHHHHQEVEEKGSTIATTTTSTTKNENISDAFVSSMRTYATSPTKSTSANNENKKNDDDDESDAWLQQLITRDGYDLSELGLVDGAHAYSNNIVLGAGHPPPDRHHHHYPQLPFASLHDNKVITGAVGIDIARGMLAFSQGKYLESFKLLSCTRTEWHLVGGSAAQRDVFEQTLVYAAVGAGYVHVARALCAERVASRPNDGLGWYIYGSVLERLEASSASEHEGSSSSSSLSSSSSSSSPSKRNSASIGVLRGLATECKNRAYLLGVNQGPGY